MSWDLKSPTVTAIVPNTGQTGGNVDVVITGTSFACGVDSWVRLSKAGEDDIYRSAATQVSVTTLTARLPLQGAAIGKWDVVMRNCEGITGTLQEGFEITN